MHAHALSVASVLSDQHVAARALHRERERRRSASLTAAPAAAVGGVTLADARALMLTAEPARRDKTTPLDGGREVTLLAAAAAASAMRSIAASPSSSPRASSAAGSTAPSPTPGAPHHTQLSASSTAVLARARALRYQAPGQPLSTASVAAAAALSTTWDDALSSARDEFAQAVLGLQMQTQTRQNEKKVTKRSLIPVPRDVARHQLHTPTTSGATATQRAPSTPELQLSASPVRSRSFLAATPPAASPGSNSRGAHSRPLAPSCHSPPPPLSASLQVRRASHGQQPVARSHSVSQSMPRRRIESALTASADLRLASPSPASPTPRDLRDRRNSCGFPTPCSPSPVPMAVDLHSRQQGTAAAAARVSKHKARARRDARTAEDAAAALRREKESAATRERDAIFKRRSEVYALNHVKRAYHEDMFLIFMEELTRKRLSGTTAATHEPKRRGFDSEISSI